MPVPELRRRTEQLKRLKSMLEQATSEHDAERVHRLEASITETEQLVAKLGRAPESAAPAAPPSSGR